MVLVGRARSVYLTRGIKTPLFLQTRTAIGANSGLSAEYALLRLTRSCRSVTKQPMINNVPTFVSTAMMPLSISEAELFGM